MIFRRGSSFGNHKMFGTGSDCECPGNSHDSSSRCKVHAVLRSPQEMLRMLPERSSSVHANVNLYIQDRGKKESCNFIFIRQVTSAMKQPRDLSIVGPPSHLSTTHRGGFTLSLSTLNINLGSCKY